jgi:hypothetical protein
MFEIWSFFATQPVWVWAQIASIQQPMATIHVRHVPAMLRWSKAKKSSFCCSSELSASGQERNHPATSKPNMTKPKYTKINWSNLWLEIL